MRSKNLLWAALAALVVTSCHSGGSKTTIPPGASWSRYRGDISNSGRAVGPLGSNTGLKSQIDLSPYGGATNSTPALGRDNILYVGTGSGLLGMPVDATSPPWLFDRWSMGGCQAFGTPVASITPTPGGPTLTPIPTPVLPVGPVNAAPAVTADKYIVFGTDAGQIFRLHDDGANPRCDWVYAPGDNELGSILSSAALRVDPLFGGPGSTFVGTGTGRLLSLNDDGTKKWDFLPPSDIERPLSSSPAIGVDNTLYTTSHDGHLYALDLAGRLLWKFPTGGALSDDTSPSVSQSIYVTGRVAQDASRGYVLAVNPDGTFRWRQEIDKPVPGSPAFARQVVAILTPANTETRTPKESPGESTVTETPTPSPTPTGTVEALVYVVDTAGTVHAFRDSTGYPYSTLKFGSAPVVSPIVSGDLFVVMGAEDGYVYASDIDGNPPCPDCTESNWEANPNVVDDQGEKGKGGRIFIGKPIRSLILGSNGVIYATTGRGCAGEIGAGQGCLYEIAPPPTPSQTVKRSSTPFSTPTPRPPTATRTKRT